MVASTSDIQKSICHCSFMNWCYFDMHGTCASPYGTKGQWLCLQLSGKTCFYRAVFREHWSPCVASSMFLPLTDITTLLLPVVQKFALEQAWWLTPERVLQTCRSYRG